MKKLVSLALVGVCMVAVLSVTGMAAEYQLRKQDLIRLHVVANSDSEADQQVKLLVRDALISVLKVPVSACADIEAAKGYLQANIEKLEEVANATLRQAGCKDTAKVTFCKEPFPAREYDSFSLPSGVYTSLCVTIGEGSGKNWWCVVFPTFCFGTASDSFVDTAAGAGFSQPLRSTLAGEKGYSYAFFFLDCIGKLENFFHFR